MPVAIAAMVVLGFIGVLIGRLFVPNDALLAWRLGYLAAFDGLGIVSLVHVLLFQGDKSRFQLHPAAVFLLFVLLGMKCGHGHGLGWLIVIGVANAIVSSAIAFGVFALLRRPTAHAR